MILSGTLLLPNGQPFKDSYVKLIAKSTSEQVLKSVTAGFRTDEDGEYSVDCPLGNYSVVVSGSDGLQTIGSIVIDENTTETNINALILLGDVAASNPLVQQVREDAESALASKNAAAVSATEASDSATASSNSAANSASSAVASANSAGTATTKAAESVASALDALNSANLTASLLSTKVSTVDLADTIDLNKGAALTGFSRQELSASVDLKTVQSVLSTRWVSVVEFAHLITVKPNINDMTTWDWTPAIAGAQAKALALASVSYGGYGVSFPAGVYPVTRIIHYSGIPLMGMGSRNTFITALPFTPAGPNPYGMLELAPGAIQGAHITGLMFCGSSTPAYGHGVVNPDQWGFYCHAQYNETFTQGGFWHSNLLDVCFWNFNKGIWSRAGYTHANSRRPNQWIDFSGVQVVVQDGGEPWLFTGQHGQITVRGGHGEAISASPARTALYSVKIGVDPDPSTTAYNGINGESTADISGVGNANRAGHSISFTDGFSFQRSVRGLWSTGPARNVTAEKCWFETLAYAVTKDGDGNISLTNNHFANAGIGTTGGGAAGSGYIVSLGASSQIDWGLGNVVEGSFDHFVSDLSSGANECNGFNFTGSLRVSANGTTILPTIAQKAPAMDASGVINMGTHKFGTVSPNADKTVRLSTITSNILPGQRITLRAATGPVTIKNSAGGNIVTGSGKDITIPVGGIATFLRITPYVAGTEFLLQSVSTHYATAVPSDGYYYAQGHIVENSTPTASTPARWECVTAGLAGSTAVFGSNFVGGQIPFPSTQIPSSDPNTLDDYKESNWTPALTFSTPGNLSVTYSAQTGQCTKVGRRVSLTIRLDLSSFTYTSASGTLTITGLPFAPTATTIGTVRFGGINKAGYTQVAIQVAGGATSATLVASGMGVAPSNITSADVPSGGTVTLWASITYDA
jgi:hypothetical protein